MSLSVVVGVSAVIIVFMLFTQLIDKEKHSHIRNFLLIIIFPLLFIIPATLVLDQTVCDLRINTTTEKWIYGNNFTVDHWNYDYSDIPNFSPADLDDPSTIFMFNRNVTYTYGEYCYEQPNGSRGFLKAFSVILVVFLTYTFIVFFGDIIKALKNVVKGK